MKIEKDFFAAVDFPNIKLPLEFELKESPFVQWIMWQFGWVRACKNNGLCGTSPYEYDCAGPFCMVWEFRPDITS